MVFAKKPTERWAPTWQKKMGWAADEIKAKKFGIEFR